MSTKPPNDVAIFKSDSLDGYLLGHREVHEAGHVVIAKVLGWPQNGVMVDRRRQGIIPDGSFADGEAFIPSDFLSYGRASRTTSLREPNGALRSRRPCSSIDTS
jgi:hypothetical protein